MVLFTQGDGRPIISGHLFFLYGYLLDEYDEILKKVIMNIAKDSFSKQRLESGLRQKYSLRILKKCLSRFLRKV